MSSNTAAWLPGARAALEVREAPYCAPKEHQLVVKNRAVAINPLDWLTQGLGSMFFSFIKYPFILGSDLAGEVVEVGPGVTRFKVGDRVLAHAVGADPKRNSAAEGAFQRFTLVLEHMASPIPPSMSFESAAVLPLRISTATCGLFEKNQLALEHPSGRPTAQGKTVLVWGGSTSVGSNAIQLAAAAGYEVFTTASPKNFDDVKSLGAAQAFDYRSPTVVAQLIAALRGKTLAGALAIGAGSSAACIDVVRACEGTKFISTASTPVSFESLPRGLALAGHLVRIVLGIAAQWLKSKASGIRTNFIYATTLASNEVGPMLYEGFLPAALAEGRYRAAPEPQRVGSGLEAVQRAIDLQRQGVSARKLVVSLGPG
jgi:NADPH:quinone reductase-like Zn-dependent oxidoreductase